MTDLSQLIREDDTVVKPFATHAERHVDKALENLQAKTNLAKTVIDLSDRVIGVANASKDES